MSATPIKIDPEKMARKVRLLFELAITKDLSPHKLAPILHVSPQQIYRWYSGDVPKAGSLALIDQGIEKIRELPDASAWGRRWYNDTPDRRQQEKKNNEYSEKAAAMLAELQRYAPPGTITSLGLSDVEKVNDFEEIIMAILDYTDVKIRIPKK